MIKNRVVPPLRFIYTKSKKTKPLYIDKKADTLQKEENLRYVFIHKKPDTLRYAIFHEIMKLAFI